MLKVIKIIGLIAAVLLIFFSVTVNSAPYLGLVIGEIGSDSMEPTLPVGSLVIAHRVAPEQLQVGDIIVFRLNATNSNVCHRIVGISSTSPLSFFTRGDNSPQPDAVAIPARNVVGKVFFYLPAAGYFAQFLKSSYGLIFGLVLPSLLVIVICLRALRREVQALKKKDGDNSLTFNSLPQRGEDISRKI